MIAGRAGGPGPSRLRGRLGFELVEDAQGVADVRAHRYLVVPGEAYDAALVDHVGDARRAQAEPAPHVIELRDRAIGVGAERERQRIDLAEAPQGIGAIGADAEDDRVLFGDGFVRIPEATRFEDSAFGEGLGEEVQDDVPLPTVV